MRLRRIPVLPFALVLAGCAAGSQSSPRSTLQTFRAAVGAHDAARIYAMLPARARQRETLAQFRARLETDGRELQDLADGVDRALSERQLPAVEVAMTTGGGATVVEDGDGWRLARAGFGPATAATERDAARAFRSALERQSLPLLLQVLSARARGALQADMASLLDALRDPGGLDVATIGTQRAVIHLPDGRSISLVREGASWRIDDVQ